MRPASQTFKGMRSKSWYAGSYGERSHVVNVLLTTRTAYLAMIAFSESNADVLSYRPYLLRLEAVDETVPEIVRGRDG